jgi:hypothetical protein
MMLVRPRERSTIKIDSKNSLYPLSQFTEHLVGVFGKLPLENDLDHKSSRLSIRWLNSTPGIQLAKLHTQTKSQSPNHRTLTTLEQTNSTGARFVEALPRRRQELAARSSVVNTDGPKKSGGCEGK